MAIIPTTASQNLKAFAFLDIIGLDGPHEYGVGFRRLHAVGARGGAVVS